MWTHTGFVSAGEVKCGHTRGLCLQGDVKCGHTRGLCLQGDVKCGHTRGLCLYVLKQKLSFRCRALCDLTSCFFVSVSRIFEES
jgi:hypothetical protein